MKQLKYLYFCEDLAHKIFLDHFLAQLPTYLDREVDILFIKPETYHSASFMFREYNHIDIKETYDSVALNAIQNYQLDIFIVGADLESHSDEKYNSLLKEMRTRLSDFKEYKDKIIIYLSVQCIEHWLWHLKDKKENPNNTKSQQIEKKERNQAKNIVYDGLQKPSKEKRREILETLLVDIDFDYLNQQSYSFRDFLGKIKEFLKTHNKSKS